MSNVKFIGEWITIKQFKGKYFAYFPSEPFYNTLIKLSDSLLIINDFNEGFVTYRLNSKKVKRKKLKASFLGYNGVENFISIKQKTKTIFIAKSSLFDSDKLYFVSRQQYYNYPIIVNHCPTSRCQEFNFK